MRGTIEESKSRAAMPHLLTPEEVAAWLQVTPKQVLRSGCPRRKLGRRTVRYDRADVQGWLDRQRR
jgi:hypothetical protein